MSSITQTCKLTGKHFVITDEDQAFYAKMGVPLPTLCPEERRRRRLAHRNERNLYHRKCDLTGKNIISIYSPDKPYKVYSSQDWWSDKWDGLAYGRDFDFNRPFFDQFKELQLAVPRINLLSMNNENSDYTNQVSHLKNCYLLFSSDFNQDCYYGTWVVHSRNCVDNSLIDQCELAYECFNSDKIYSSIYCFNSYQCSDSGFLFDCKSCQNCFMSYGLRNKQYYFKNQPCSPEEYAEKVRQLNLGSAQGLKSATQEFSALVKSVPRLYMNRTGRVENCTGDILTDCENCLDSYELMRAKDCRYIHGGFDLKDAYDCSYAVGELGYENCECVPMPQNSAFNINSYTGANLFYTDICMNNCQYLFGCVGLKQKRYCILNKQYTKEEYEALVPRIIEHMKKTGEWGEFFPISLSPFAYNETNGQEHFPLSREEALQKGYTWKEDDAQTSYSGPMYMKFRTTFPKFRTASRRKF